MAIAAYLSFLRVERGLADATLREGGCGPAGSCIEHRHILIERANEFLGFGKIAARLARCVGPSRQVVPARATRCLRVGRDDLDAGFHQVRPILDALRVALADDEHDGGCVGGTVVRQFGLPILRQQVGLIRDDVDVTRESKGDHVGLEAVDDGASLLARASVGLFDFDRLAGFGLPVGGERFVEFGVKFPGGVIGNIEKFRRVVEAGEQKGQCKCGE